MPTLDRRPRRRLRSPERGPEFANELDARAQAAEVGRMPAGPERDAALAAIRPKLERWIQAEGRKAYGPDLLAALVRCYLFRPHFLPLLPPAGVEGTGGP